ncbi:hypothetical protein [Maribellus sediminis]|uniref:hypothetical protein n=1 Tax=Maribellus sediminis TaxID=2696285 RepID=UPI001430593B|nr:hypothetical protein [Maribellus sediminis]
MRIVLAAILVFSNILAFGHDYENLKYSITIDALAGINRMKLNMKIERNSEQVKIYYNKLVDVDPKYKENHEEMERLYKNMSNAKSKKQKERALNKLKKYRAKYEIYKDDSIVLNPSENAEYLNLIDSIYKADEKELLRDRRSGLNITLDGTSFNIKVLEKHKTIKDLYIHSPRDKSHPLINKLICDTLDLYRTQNPNSFLNKDLTNGY